MAAIVRAVSLLTTVRSEATTTGDGALNGKPPPSPVSTPARLHLSVSKPAWVVRTESNVRKEKRRNPEPPCVVCRGSGRVDCYDCHGTGRTNHTKLTVLPKGEWPKWCRSCGGSGLGYCSRCVGTGEYRYIMGFQFMKKDSDDQIQDNQIYQLRDRLGSRSFTEILLDNDDQLNSGNES